MIELGEVDLARLAGLYERLSARLPALVERFCMRLTGQAEAPEFDEERILLVDWLSAGLVGSRAAADALRGRLVRLQACWRMPQLFESFHLLRDEYDDLLGELCAPDEARLARKSLNKWLDRELAALTRQHVDHTASADRISAIQTLSMGLAHELRNPVNSACLQLEVIERRLRSQGGTDPKLIGAVHAVAAELERLTRLLGEFLSFARPTELVVGPRNVGQLIHQVVIAERPLATARGVTLSEQEAGELVASVDGGKVQQIVQNLVRNAIEACKLGGHVAVSARSDGDALRIDVQDDGPGIPEATQRRMYEPFFTTKDSGTGLGLAIVHSYVQLHGGHIELESTRTGSRFQITLPQHTS